jgi:tol-pal system protein YbgF
MSVMRATLPTLTLALLLAVPSAGFAQNREHQQMFADLRMLQEQVQQLRLALNSLAESVKAVNAKQDEQANATRRAFADQKLLTDAVTDSIRILREKGDDTNVRISTLAHEVEAMRQAMQALQSSVVQAVAASAAAPQPGAPPAGDPGAAAAGAQTAPPVNVAAVQSPKVLYENAYSDYAATRYDLAIQGFQAYLRTFPNSPDAYMAQFQIGESYYALGRYREAAQAYREVIDNYKTAPWVPDAYYKRGLSYRELGNKDQARADFQYVIKTFPDNTLAPLAKAALDSIK